MPAVGLFSRRLVTFAAIVVATAATAFAQPPGGGFSGGFRPNPDEIVDRLDENKNGQADPDEMQGRSRFFLEGLARDNGLDLSKPIKNDKLKELLRARWSGGSSSSSGSRSSSSSKPSPPAVATPGVLGFGTTTTGTPPTVPGFGPPPSSDSWDVIREKYGRRVMEEVEEDMGRYDRNKDGVLDKEEMKDGRWRSDPLEFDKNKDGKLSRGEMADREVGRSSSSGSSSGYGGSSYGGSNYGGSSYGGYGFGGGPGYGGGLGFGGGQPQMVVMRSGSSSSEPSGGGSTNGGSSTTSSSGDVNDRAAKMVSQILGLYDTNKDGMIGKSEMSQVHATYRKADTDSDGTISKDELTKYALSMLPAASTPSGNSSGGSSGSKSGRYGSSSRGSSGGSSGSSGEKKSYRFRTPAERLPDGLPEWFASRDADADGQVAMAEFATSWSDAKVKEFTDWDANGDGILTPAECLKK
jgi:Ca2+-binding EF-hand superfamily protein